MSLEFNDSPYCKGKTCTNLLSCKADYDVGHCYLCYQDILNSGVKKLYKCNQCGNIKILLINHDQLPEVWERCTDNCMWSRKGELGNYLYSSDDIKTGFRLRKFTRVKG